jgi:hypothetical protein
MNGVAKSVAIAKMALTMRNHCVYPFSFRGEGFFLTLYI